jgi:hypothetical protein
MSEQWADQQDPEQRIAELERQAEAANRAAGRPSWPNAPDAYGFSRPIAWSAELSGTKRSPVLAIAMAAAVAVVLVAAGTAFAMFFLSRPSRSVPSPGGGSSPAASAAAPVLPPSTTRIPDESYKAYGEVPIPGNGTLHLPAGQLAIFFHAKSRSAGFGQLVVPDLHFNLDPPAGAAEPDVTESMGGTTRVDNVGWRRVWIGQIPQEGDYKISTDGKVGEFAWARLAFGQVDDQ